jgi:hypothetical protein
MAIDPALTAALVIDWHSPQWLSLGIPIVWAMRWYLTAGSSTAPVSICPTIERWISCHGD